MTKTEAQREADRQWKARNRERLRLEAKQYRLALKMEALERYGKVCAHCGYDNPLALQVDHIEDNGAEERKSLGGQHVAGWNFYRNLRARGWPEGYQTLCANCNAIKQAQTHMPL